jgi:hypothetical protein
MRSLRTASCLGQLVWGLSLAPNRSGSEVQDTRACRAFKAGEKKSTQSTPAAMLTFYFACYFSCRILLGRRRRKYRVA